MNSNDISNINNLYNMLNQREFLKQKLKERKNEKEYLEERKNEKEFTTTFNRIWYAYYKFCMFILFAKFKNLLYIHKFMYDIYNKLVYVYI